MALVIHIITVRGNQSYKIMWIIFILVVPVFGVLAYMLFGGGRVLPHIKKRMKNCKNKYLSKILANDCETKLNYSDMLHFRQAAFLRNEANLPIHNNTKSTFLESGEVFFEEVLKSLKAAEKYNIDLSKSYIIGDTNNDIQTAINGGLKSIRVPSAAVEENAIKADFDASNLLEAVNIILGE